MNHASGATGVAARPLRALASIALLAGSATLVTATPAGAAMTTVDVEVVGQGGQIFPAGTAGVLACAEPCESLEPSDDLIIGLADGDGIAQLEVGEDVAYQAQGFALNTGWREPDLVLGTFTVHVGEPLRNVYGADLDGLSFIVPRPTGPPSSPGPPPSVTPGMVDVQLLVFDADGDPFPVGTAGVMFCAATCEGGYEFFSAADADGIVLATVEPQRTYFVTALVTGTGWACGGWDSGSDLFWFSDEVRFGAAGSMNNLTTLTIHEPDCI